MNIVNLSSGSEVKSAPQNPFMDHFNLEARTQRVWDLNHAIWFTLMGLGGGVFLVGRILNLTEGLGHWLGIPMVDIISFVAIAIGGLKNSAGDEHSAIVGGDNNQVVEGKGGLVLGGQFNTVSDGDYATIAGGKQGTTVGTASAIFGGQNGETAGTFATIRSTSGRNPISSISSASSSTRYLTSERLRCRCCTRSMRRPGVPTTTSIP